MISTSNSPQNWWLPRKGGRDSIALLVLLRVLGVRPSQQKMDGGRVLFIMWSMCKPHFLEMHIESLEILRLQVTLWNQYSIDTHSHVYTHVFIHTHTHVGDTCPIRKMNSSQFPSCINHEFFFFIFWCLDIWGLADVGRIAPSRNCQFLEVVNNLAMDMTFKCEPINPEPYPQPPALVGSHSYHCLLPLSPQGRVPDN